MKTLKIFTIFALVATFSLATISPAWAHCRPFPHGHPHPCHRPHHNHDNGGAVAGAALGGAALGLVLGSAMSQPKQAPQPQVVVVQPKANDTGISTQQQYQALELERQRARNIALEQELARLRAISGTE